MTEPNILAFQNADILALLDENPGQLTKAAIAERTGRDKSNLNKTLQRLVEEGLLQAVPTDGLTDAGRDQLAAYRRAQHGGDRRRARGQWPLEKFRPNPLNRPVRREVLADMAASMRGPAGLVQRVRATAPDANGVRMLIDGEHRWEAAKLVLNQVFEEGGDLPDWLADGLPFEEAEADPATALVITLVANARRADMSPWEDAQQLLKLQKATDWSAAELARQIGRVAQGETAGLRDVQQKLKIAREATPQAIADYERNGSWDALRDSVTRPKAPTLSDQVAQAGAAVVTTQDASDGLSAYDRQRRKEVWAACEALKPKQLLVLLETADKVIRAPDRESFGRYTTLAEHWRPDHTKASDHLVRSIGFGFGSGGGKPSFVSIGDAAWAWLESKAYLTPEGVVPYRLGLARQEALGIGAEAKLRESGRYWTEWLNLEPASAEAPDAEAAPTSPPAGPHVVNGVDYGNATRANEARRALGLMPPLPAPNYGGGARRTEDQTEEPASAVIAGAEPRPLPAAPPTLMSAHLKALAQAKADPTEAALRLIAKERARQVAVEGFSSEQDDEENGDGELAYGAAAYAASAAGDADASLFWPGGWNPYMFKPTGDERDLVRAGALIVAELERRARQARSAAAAQAELSEPEAAS